MRAVVVPAGELTKNLNSSKSHRLILNEANNILSFSNSVENIILSRVHPSFELDLVFKEAYFSWIFGLISPKKKCLIRYARCICTDFGTV